MYVHLKSKTLAIQLFKSKQNRLKDRKNDKTDYYSSNYYAAFVTIKQMS